MVVVGVRVVWSPLEHAAVHRTRFLEAAEIFQDVAVVTQCGRRIRIQFECVLITGGRGIKATASPKRRPEIGPCRRISPVDLERASIKRYGGIQLVRFVSSQGLLKELLYDLFSGAAHLGAPEYQKPV